MSILKKDSEEKDRKLFMMGNHMINPPLVSPPPPIFDTG